MTAKLFENRRCARLQCFYTSILTCCYVLTFVDVCLGRAGVDLVKSELPELYEAAHTAFPQEQADKIFENWTFEEIDFFRNRSSFLIAQTKGASGPIDDPKHLFARHNNMVVGLFGEIDGAQYARNFAQSSERGSVYISETQYRKHNKSRLHDGMVVNFNNDTLTIEMVIEAKVGNARYNRDQVGSMGPGVGYLRRWQRVGLTIEGPSGQVRHYLPSQIFISPDLTRPTIDQEIPVTGAEVDDIEEITLLVGTRARYDGFRGLYRPLTLNPDIEEPVSIESLMAWIETYIKILAKDLPIKIQAPMPVMPKPRSKVTTVATDFLPRLQAYILAHGHLPTASTGVEGKALSMMMILKGGRSDVFINSLSLEWKLYLHNKGNIPAERPLARKIFDSSPYALDGSINESVLDALIIYMDTYQNSPSPPTPSLIDILVAKKPAWRQFLERGGYQSITARRTALKAQSCSASFNGSSH